MFRRSRHLRIAYDSSWDCWWRLGRRMVERHLTVLPVPLESPRFLVGLSDRWFVVCPESTARDGVANRLIIAIADGGANALTWSRGWILSGDLALSLGQRGWNALVTGAVPAADADFLVERMDEALVLLGAMGRMPALFRFLPSSDWVLAARLMRHPSRRMAAVRPLPSSWGFQFDADSGEAWWSRQDEDSVH